MKSPLSFSPHRHKRESTGGILKTRVKVKLFGLPIWKFRRPSKSQEKVS
jgi:hypothetical protein